MNELELSFGYNIHGFFYGNGNSNGIDPENLFFCGDCGVWMPFSKCSDDHLNCINGKNRIIGSIQESNTPHSRRPMESVRVGGVR